MESSESKCNHVWKQVQGEARTDGKVMLVCDHCPVTKLIIPPDSNVTESRRKPTLLG